MSTTNVANDDVDFVNNDKRKSLSHHGRYVLSCDRSEPVSLDWSHKSATSRPERTAAHAQDTANTGRTTIDHRNLTASSG